MSNVSKDKLRRLPYDMRVNLMSHHKDFVEEAGILLKEFKDRSHPKLEKIIIEKFSNHTSSFLAYPNIDSLSVVKGSLSRMNKSIFNISNTYRIISIADALKRRDNDNEEMRVTANYIANFLLDGLDVASGDAAFKNMYNAFVEVYNRLYSYIDSDNAVSKLMAYADNENVLDGIKEIYNRTNDPKVRKDIMNSIGVLDILI